jgi:hypothetical protein
MTAHDATSTEWSRARCSASTSKCLRTPCSTPDAEEDARVLEAALAGHAEFLVTYNIEDFLPACTAHPVTGHPHCLGVQVIKPADLAVLLGLAPAGSPPAHPHAATTAKVRRARPGIDVATTTENAGVSLTGYLTGAGARPPLRPGHNSGLSTRLRGGGCPAIARVELRMEALAEARDHAQLKQICSLRW